MNNRFKGKENATASNLSPLSRKRVKTTIAVSVELNKKIEMMLQISGLAGAPQSKEAFVAEAIEQYLKKKEKELPPHFQVIYAGDIKG